MQGNKRAADISSEYVGARISSESSGSRIDGFTNHGA